MRLYDAAREAAAELRVTREGLALLAAVFGVMAVVAALWWPRTMVELRKLDLNRPLLPQLDWLLAGIYAVMLALLAAGARPRRDLQLAFVALWGGLVIECWGTETLLWKYYTKERPPLWIVPAWPIATVASDRVVRLLDRLLPRSPPGLNWAYAAAFLAFYAVMLGFVWPTRHHPITLGALALCALVLLSPPDLRLTLIIFAAGSGLGYFLELWGTTRRCWTYYTRERPPLFPVLAHGMATVAFWRGALYLRRWARLAPEGDLFYR